MIPMTRCTKDCKVIGIELLPNVPFTSVLLRPTGDTYGIIVGRVDYSDGDGTPHKTGVCFVHNIGSHDLRDCGILGSNYAD